MRLTKALVVVLLLAVHASAASCASLVASERYWRSSFSAVAAVRIDGQSFDVAVEGSEAGDVSVEIIYPDHYQFSCAVDDTPGGRVLRIGVSREGLSMLNMARLKILVKAPLATAVDVITTSGSVTVNGMRGGLSVRSRSGDTRVASHRGYVTLEALSGNVSLVGCVGGFSLKTGAGDVKGTGLTIEAASGIRTGSGNVSLDIDSPLEALGIYAESASGLLLLRGARYEGRLQLGAGPAGLRIETSSGDIDVK